MIDMTNLTDTMTSAVNDAMKRLDVTKLDLTKFDLRNVELPSFDFPTIDLPFDLPKFDLPKVDLPEFELPAFEMPRFQVPEFDVPAEVDRVADFVRDAAYVGIGAAVIAAQRVDAEVRKLTGAAAA